MSSVLQCFRRAADLSERGGTGIPSVRVRVQELLDSDPEDVRAGFDLVLASADPGAGLEELLRSGALGLFPEVTAMVGFGGGAQGHKDLWSHTKTVVSQTHGDVVLRWCSLFHDVGKVSTFSRAGGKVSFHGHEGVGSWMFKRAARRTRMFTDAEVARISEAVFKLGRVEAYSRDWTDSAVRRLAKDLGDSFDDVVRLSAADITTGRQDKRRTILNQLDEFVRRSKLIAEADSAPPLLPKGLGTALCSEFGLDPGPGLGRLMAAVKASVEDGSAPRGAGLEELVAHVRARAGHYGIKPG